MRRTCLLLLPILAGCGLREPAAEDPEVEFAEPGCGEITPAGGSVELGPLSVAVGPGVVEQDVELCIVEAGDAPSAYLPRTPLWQLEGDLPEDAEISVRYAGGVPGADALYVSDAAGAWAPFQTDEGDFVATAVGLPRIFLGAGVFRPTFVHDGTDVDVLFIVDNSCSMGEEQAGIAESFPAMLDFFVESELDWRVGVVSTDMDNNAYTGKLREYDGHLWIDGEDADPQVLFREMSGLGTTGSGNEKGLDALYAALELKTEDFNAGFLRPESQIAVIALSDEEDKSDVKVDELADWFVSLRPPGDTFFHSIVSPHPLCDGATEPGARYLEVTEAVGGVSWSICDSPYDRALVDICEDFWGSDWLQLEVLPDVETLVVTVTEPGAAGTILGEGEFLYDEATNRLRLARGWHPVKGSEIEVSYQPR